MRLLEFVHDLLAKKRGIDNASMTDFNGKNLRETLVCTKLLDTCFARVRSLSRHS